MMELKQEEEVSEPVSPTAQYFNSSVLSVSILAIMHFEVPLDDLPTMSLLKDVFLHINPRFSSIMDDLIVSMLEKCTQSQPIVQRIIEAPLMMRVSDQSGVKQWKKVEVELKDHINVPIFPTRMSLEYYDQYLDEYLSKIGMEQLPQSRPLWEVHIIKYPTRNAAGSVVFKIHHVLGDDFSLMGALLSCLQRPDNPSLPLTFPSCQSSLKSADRANKRIVKKVSRIFSFVFNTITDFGWSFLKSSLVKDDRTVIRSGDLGVEFQPIVISTMTFSLYHIKQMKAKLGVTINDVMTGIIFLGTRLYMQDVGHGTSHGHSTAIVALNTRNLRSYMSMKEIVEPHAEAPWGNHFAFLHISIPNLTTAKFSNPLEFVWKAHKLIKKKRNSLGVHLTSKVLEAVRKYRGPEASARHIHRTLRNSSMSISNLIGPVEQMALAAHPIKGFYFMGVGVPQSLVITMVSYMGKLTVAVRAEKGFTDSQKFKSCVENAFEVIFKAACEA